MPVTLPSRAIFSIEPDVLSQFNALFAPRERSKVVERLIKAELDTHRQAVLDAICKIESDPRCASIAQVSADMDALAGDAW
jgi:hypothetical protein